MTLNGTIPIFLAHGALGNWDDLALAVIGLLLLAYLAFIAIRQRRSNIKVETNRVPGVTKDEKVARLD